jgi:hypothetical protein
MAPHFRGFGPAVITLRRETSRMIPIMGEPAAPRRSFYLEG